MAKTRHNFTLSQEVIEKLKNVENKSQFVQEAVTFYHANMNKAAQIVEIEPRNASFRLKRVIV